MEDSLYFLLLLAWVWEKRASEKKKYIQFCFSLLKIKQHILVGKPENKICWAKCVEWKGAAQMGISDASILQKPVI